MAPGPQFEPPTQAMIARVMERRGARCSMEEFHAAVNTTFHQFESEVYDREHRAMWDSLPRQFDLLLEDWLRREPAPPGRIRLLDIGCGTGLASNCLMNGAIGGRIEAVDLLDTSPAMLAKARARAGGWKVPVRMHVGTLEVLAGGGPYELIVACSVLHHIPDLPGFLSAVRGLQTSGGAFLHLQDPNGDYLDSPELRRRKERFDGRLAARLQRFQPRRVYGRLYRMVTGKPMRDYITETNRALLEAGVIAAPLSVAELFSITDIHANDGEGISLARMQSRMPDYDCVARRSYGFFGELASTLPRKWRALEEDLVARAAPDGNWIGAVWRLRL